MNDLAELLRAGRVDEFNALRGQRRKVDLFAEDLAKTSIVGVDLSGANLEKADLSGSDLTDANLARADLSGVDAPEAKFVGAIMAGTRLREGVFEGADFTDADMTHADVAGAILAGSSGPRCRWNHARLKEVDARRVQWPEADLSEAKMQKADFTGASLPRSDFTEAHAGEANFTNADLDACVALRARFQDANLTGARLANARLEEANLERANLTDANLERADLRRANLTGAVLKGARLRGAVLADAILDSVDFSGVDLSDVDLSGVDARALGLSPEQLSHVAAVGAKTAKDSPIHMLEASVAVGTSHVGVFWENEDSETTLSLRWAVVDAAGSIVQGVLPLSADGVLARAIAPVPDGFLLLVVQDRPGGIALLRYRLSGAGELGTAQAEPLGYEPGVRPVVHSVGSTVFLWGLSRRGPAVVVQRIDEVVTLAASARVPTARGFIGQVPVLACKGGVIIPVGPEGVRSPLRTPAGFEEGLAAAAVAADRVLVAWVEPARNQDDPGGVRCAWLGERGAPRVDNVARGPGVTALDVLAVGAEVWIAWVQNESIAWVRRLGAETPTKLPLPEDFDISEIRFAAAPEGQSHVAGPVIALTSMDGRLLLARASGPTMAILGGGA